MVFDFDLGYGSGYGKDFTWKKEFTKGDASLNRDQSVQNGRMVEFKNIPALLKRPQNIFDSGWFKSLGNYNWYHPVFDFVETADFATTFVAKLIFSNFLF
ncbi:unnamed protein product [Rhizophagus irregularis]|nr:unnamed protein product [Rhizophagus irregularis]